MIIDPQFRPGSHCQIYDHDWRVTSMKGRSQCRVCEKLAYCPECSSLHALTIPLGALRVRCSSHTTNPGRRSDPDAETVP